MHPEIRNSLLRQDFARPVALWTFEESAPPYRDLVGGHLLGQAPGAQVRTVEDPELGSAASFNGSSDYLQIPAAEVGDLNVALAGDAVTVLAWVRRRTSGLGFVAGMWQEHDADPRRQYGLFVDLGMYGGKDRVAGHVSSSGAASPGLPYSRDACASARMINFDDPRMVGFTYDGNDAIAYLDGIADSRPEFRDPPAPYGLNLTYAKNPFRFTDGLNRHAISDFTVGAVLLTAGVGNFFGGEIGGVMIFDSVLSAEEIMAIQLITREDRSIAELGFFRTGDVLNAHDVRSDWPTAEAGWTSWPAEAYVFRRDVDLGYVTRREASTDSGAITFSPIVGLPIEAVDRLHFRRSGDSSLGVMVLIDSVWYLAGERASAQPSATDWVDDGCDLRTGCGEWRAAQLGLDGALHIDSRTVGLPSGRLQGIGFVDGGPHESTQPRIADVYLR